MTITINNAQNVNIYNNTTFHQKFVLNLVKLNH